MQVRTRTNNEAMHGGKECEGKNQSEQPCYSGVCPKPGDWLEWGVWSACSRSCDGGQRNRTRVCDWTTHGVNLTLACIGNGADSQVCNNFSCEPIPKTCTELKDRGMFISGSATISPDFKLLKVWCDFEMEGGVGVTIIGHSLKNFTRVSGYEGAGEYMMELKYDPLKTNDGVDSLVTLADQSLHCKQYISWKCHKAGIVSEKDGVTKVTYWENRYGTKRDYWGGAEHDSGMCACGMNSTCFDKKKKCNCDSNDDRWHEDQGYLTFKDDLPITTFRAGDTSVMHNEEGQFLVGPLICWGTDPHF
ncbi:contactin-associated protein like 5-3-like [Tubulanus polymorphus]|uniref:contactin-associated protein like 5-3-like n=1 Tax=Tubulanus polymorphus TaxID=672921 RepID=UPI003DA4738A